MKFLVEIPDTPDNLTLIANLPFQGLETSALALDIGDAITQYGTYEGVRVTPVEDTK